jgi:hypothetical protein
MFLDLADFLVLDHTWPELWSLLRKVARLTTDAIVSHEGDLIQSSVRKKTDLGELERLSRQVGNEFRDHVLNSPQKQSRLKFLQDTQKTWVFSAARAAGDAVVFDLDQTHAASRGQSSSPRFSVDIRFQHSGFCQ